ncbi:SDR family oxidoreductase [Novosphingobium lentum]|uniref:SDR family oxidoreductase n=1 Tax=Novosphingobium lentum TaxID=145287 RepID=UPI00082E1410|nr:SDR family NAD(P)-dependent oxidoreductase [Novosphingobium lentum]
MTGPFAGKAIIVTGASSGLGRAIAVDLARQGADLWLVGRSGEALAETAGLISAAGGPVAQSEPMDLRIRGPLAKLIEVVGATHPHLFAVINNAGVMYPEPILSGTIERWQEMLDINVMAMLEGSKAAVLTMRKHGQEGHVINLGSVQARFEEPGVYGISKKAAEMIGNTLRAEVEGDPIRVATVIPGGFATQLARGFTPESLANLSGNLTRLNLNPENGDDMARIVGDPRHIADAVRYILSQPIGINIQEMVVRPPVSTKA